MWLSFLLWEIKKVTNEIKTTQELFSKRSHSESIKEQTFFRVGGFRHYVVCAPILLIRSNIRLFGHTGGRIFDIRRRICHSSQLFLNIVLDTATEAARAARGGAAARKEANPSHMWTTASLNPKVFFTLCLYCRSR